MAIRDTYNYSYRVGRKDSRRETASDPASLERKYQRVHPGGNVTVLGLAKMRASAGRCRAD